MSKKYKTSSGPVIKTGFATGGWDPRPARDRGAVIETTPHRSVHVTTEQDLEKLRRADARARALRNLANLTDAENAEITADAMADPDNQPADDLVRRRGRPPLEHPKEAVKLRLDADVLEHFRSTGPGWQTRINETLRQAAKLK